MAAALRAALAVLVLVPILLGTSTAGAVKVEVDKDTFLDFHLLLQPWGQYRYEDPANNPDVQHSFGDFYLRRARIVVAGQITKWVSFFAETDQPNWGKGGNWSTSTIVQDAYMSLNFHESFQLVTGMLITPFIHNASQGATNLHTLDYHADFMKYPDPSHKVWRDMGVMFRGFLLKKKIDYRIAITNGVQHGAVVIPAKAATATAPAVPAVYSETGEVPRFSGRVAYNFFDAEEGFFLGGTYLGQKKVLSLGFAFDAQPGVYGQPGVSGQNTAYYGLGGDLFFDIPMGWRRLSGQLNFVTYGGKDNPNRGLGMLFDVGYALGRAEPVIAIDWYKPNAADNFDGHLFGLHLGFNWWHMGHRANLKADLGLIKNPGVEFKNLSAVLTLQTQLFF